MKFPVQVLLWVSKQTSEALLFFSAYLLTVAAVPCHPRNTRLPKEPSTEWCWRLMFVTPLCSYFLSSVFSLHFHLLYKKLLLVVWCPLLLHHKYRTSHIFSHCSAAYVYKVRTQSWVEQGIPSWLVHTICKPFPDPANCLRSANPNPSLLTPTSFLNTLRATHFPVCRYLDAGYHHIQEKTFRRDSVCVRVWCYRKKPAIYPHTCGKPSHNTSKQNDVKTTFLLFQPFWRSQLLHAIRGEMAETPSKRKKLSELQCLNSFFP